MEITRPYNIVTNLSPAYQSHNKKQRDTNQNNQSPNYKKRDQLTTYKEKHTMDFLA